MCETHLSKARARIIALIESEVNFRQKQLNEVVDLLEGSYDIRLYEFNLETMRLTQGLCAEETVAVIESREPERKMLKNKALKSRRLLRLIKRENELRLMIGELNWELDMLKRRYASNESAHPV